MVVRQFFLGFIAFMTVIVGAVWFTLKRDNIPFEHLERAYEQTYSRYLDLPGGIRAHVVDIGPRRNAPILIVVHDIAGSASDWNSWMLELEDDVRVIAVDLPGHGLTQSPFTYRASIDAASAFIDDIAETMELETHSIAGASMGAMVAWTYALDHPESVDSLILIGAEGWEASPEELAANPLSDTRIVQDWMRPFLERLDMSTWLQSYLETSFSDPERVTDAMKRRQADFSLAPGHRRALLDYQLAPRRSATTNRLEKINAPTLIMHGENDVITSLRTARLFEASLPASSLITYEGAGHAVHQEVPKRSAADFLAFLTLNNGANAQQIGLTDLASVTSASRP